MKRMIYKVSTLDVPGTWEVPVPGDSIRVLSVDNGECWYEFTYQELLERQQTIEFLTAWTGEAFDLPVDFNFVGTTKVGPLVVHLYWRLAP
jgi:hypothetical protein